MSEQKVTPASGAPLLARARKARGVAAAFGAHLVLAVVFFLPALLAGHALVPAELLHVIYPWGAYLQGLESHNADHLDVIQQFYPWTLFLRQSVSSGELPLWNPHSALGLPFAANPLTASWFPLSWLPILLGPVAGWNALLVLRLAVAGSGTWLLLRTLGRSRVACAAGSIAYAYSIPFVTFLQMSLANVNALLPWLIATAVLAGRKPSAPRAAAFGTVLLLAHLGGQPEATLVYAAAGALTALLAVPGATPAARLRSLGAVLGGGAVGTLAASIQVLPFLEYLSRSQELLQGHARSASLPLTSLVTWVVPLFHGRFLERSAWGGGPGYVEAGASAGAFMVAFACAGAVCARGRRALLPLGLFLAGASLCYGIPPVSLLLESLPIAGRMRVQRALPLVAIAVVIAAAHGLDRLAAARRARATRVRVKTALLLAVPLAAALLVLAIEAPSAPEGALAKTALPGLAHAAIAIVGGGFVAAVARPGALRMLGVCAVVLIDTWTTTFGVHSSVPADMVFFPTGLTRFLSSREGSARTLPLGYVMPPGSNLPYGIASLLNYDAIGDHRQAAFLRQLGGYADQGLYPTVLLSRIRNPRVLELAAVRYLVQDPTAPPVGQGGTGGPAGLTLDTVYDGVDGRVYELPSAQPRLWAAGTARADPGLSSFRSALERRDPASAREVFVDAREVPAGDGLGVTVTERSRRAGEIVASVDAAGASWLFLAEGYDPGWVARVDGRPAAVYPANGVFLAVPVPPGVHEVRLLYRPRSFLAGAILSAIGIAALAGLATLGRAGRGLRRPVR